MALTLDYAARSDVGLVRSENQDSGYAGPHLLVVADGMGGHAGGDIASSTVIGYLVELDEESHSSGESGDELARAIAKANAELRRIAAARTELHGMGTTVTALLRSRNSLAVAHIGDSRAYILRDGQLGRMTADHTFVQTLVDSGRLAPEEVSTHPQRSLVTRVLTGAERDRPDIGAREVHLGDRYLLCSDGLSGFVAADTIAEILAAGERPAPTCDRLVELALRAGAPDNVTVIVADVVSVTAGPPPAATPQIVGAARLSPAGARALRDTPAAKAAELRRRLGLEEETEQVEVLALAEEGSRTRGRRAARWLGGLAAAAVVIAGGSYAAYGWSQSRYFIGTDGGTVTLYRGVDYSLGPVNLATPVETTDIATGDLPDYYRQQVEQSVSVSDRAQANERLSQLRTQAAACAKSKAKGQSCGADAQVPSSTSSSPAASPSGSSTSGRDSTSGSATSSSPAASTSGAATPRPPSTSTRPTNPAVTSPAAPTASRT